MEETREQLIVEARLLASEPLKPPAAMAERKAWEARIRTRREAIRRAIAELADLAAILDHERRETEEPPGS